MVKNYKKKSHYISKKYGYTGKKKLFKRYTNPSFGEGLHNRKVELNFKVYIFEGKFSFIDNSLFTSRRVHSSLILNPEFNALQTLFGMVKLLGVKVIINRTGWNSVTSGASSATMLPPLRILWTPYGEVSAFPNNGVSSNDDCLMINSFVDGVSKYYPVGRDLIQTGYGSTTSVTGGNIWTSTAFVDELPDWSGSLYLDAAESTSAAVAGAEVYMVRLVLYLQYCKAGYWIIEG